MMAGNSIGHFTCSIFVNPSRIKVQKQSFYSSPLFLQNKTTIAISSYYSLTLLFFSMNNVKCLKDHGLNNLIK